MVCAPDGPTAPPRILRNEDARLLRGAGTYRDDLRLGQLHLAFVRSSVAGAAIEGIDTEAARTAPGVLDVLRAADLDLEPMVAHSSGLLPHDFDRPPLALDRVRFVGEPVAVVVARSRAAAEDAAALVVVDYGPASPLPDPESALADGAALLFEATGSNVAHRQEHADAGALEEAEVVVEGRFVNNRVAPAPMETNGALALLDEDGRVVVWASSQRVHGVRDELAACLRLDPSQVRVVAPLVGGGFGGKYDTPAEAVVAAAVARRLGRPVLWSETRSENLVSMAHGRGQVQTAALGLRRDGTVVGLRCDLVADAGGYPTLGALVIGLCIRMLPWVYGIPRLDARAMSVATTSSTVGAYRGPGRAEPGAMVERLIDMAAAELGMDPVELRRRNLLAPEAFPYTSVTGMTYDTGDYRRCLDQAVELLGYDGLRREQARRRAANETRALGVGVAMWLDITPSNRPGEYAAVDLVAEGGRLRALVRAGTADQGQAHETTWGIILAETLGIPVHDVTLLPADTALVPYGTGTGSARSLQVTGGSVLQAGLSVLEQARAVAAHLFEVAPEDVVRAPDGLAVAGTPSRVLGWAELAAAAASDDLPAELRSILPRGGLGAEADVLQAGPTFPAGCHAAVVEVDLETGGVELVRFVTVDDCGRVVNPVVVAGQQQGGAAQGIAQALFEEIRYDATANPLTSTLADYLVPSAADLPPLEVHTVASVTPVNALGSKGIGQSGAIGATPAVQNAVVDALAHLGVRHIDLPCTPERVWRAVRDAGWRPG